MYTYTIKTDALAVEIEASTADAAAVMFGRSAGLSGDNCQEILESVSGVVGAWMWIESDDAPDGDRRGGSSPEVLQEYLAEVAAREAAENQPRLEIVSRGHGLHHRLHRRQARRDCREVGRRVLRLRRGQGVCREPPRAGRQREKAHSRGVLCAPLGPFAFPPPSSSSSSTP